MNILAIDTSQEVLSLALSSPNGIFHIEIYAGTRHSELLMECIDMLVNKAGIEPNDLELAACMKGPGAFTGLRIAYAAVKGLSLSLGIPFAAIPTLDCIAFAHSIWPGIILSALDAKKNCFFAAFYRGEERLSPYMDMDIKDIFSFYKTLQPKKGEALLISGSGAKQLIARMDECKIPGIPKPVLDPFFSRGRAIEMLQLLNKHDNIKYIEDEMSAPLYLRKSDAELNLNLIK